MARTDTQRIVALLGSLCLVHQAEADGRESRAQDIATRCDVDVEKVREYQRGQRDGYERVRTFLYVSAPQTTQELMENTKTFLNLAREEAGRGSGNFNEGKFFAFCTAGHWLYSMEND